MEPTNDNQVTLTPDHKKNFQDFSEVVTLLRKIESKGKKKDATDKEVVARLEGEIKSLSDKLNKATVERKGQFNVGDVDLDKVGGDITIDGKSLSTSAARSGRHTLDVLMDMNSKGNPELEEAQAIIDRAHIASLALKTRWNETLYFQEFGPTNAILRKTMDIANVANWQPTVFSRRMIEKVRLRLVLAAQHDRFNMPSNPYKFPIEGEDAQVYLVSERGEPNDHLTPGNLVPAGLTQTLGTNLTFDAVKLGTRVVLSEELTEDSFIPIVSYVEDKVAQAMADAQENALVNGDTASGLDTLSYGATSHLTAWDGYRKFATGASYANSVAWVDAGGGLTVELSDLRKVRQNMGKFGTYPRDLFYACGPVGYVKMLSIGSGVHESPVITLDKYGPNATIVNGEIGKVDGIRILLTEFMGPVENNISYAESLDQNGLYDGGTTTDYTSILLVRPEAMAFGDRRAATMKTREIIETDQRVLVVLQRLDFQCRRPGTPVVGGLYNILK